MTARPWMPLYVGDYLADTAHLRAAESGAYIHLIMHYWRHGGLQDDDFQLASIARMTAEEWTRARPLLEPLFKAGVWKHKRIEIELAKTAARAAAGREGGKQTASKRPSKAQANEQQTTEQTSSDPPSKPVIVIVEEAIKEDSIPKVESESIAARAKEKTEHLKAEFDIWYAKYPLKVGPKDAFRAFVKARKEVEFQFLLDGLELYKRNKPPDISWSYPATWLNKGRWADQLADKQLFGGNDGKTGNGSGARNSFGFSGLSARIRAGQTSDPIRREQPSGTRQSTDGLGDPERGLEFVDSK